MIPVQPPSPSEIGHKLPHSICQIQHLMAYEELPVSIVCRLYTPRSSFSESSIPCRHGLSQGGVWGRDTSKCISPCIYLYKELIRPCTCRAFFNNEPRPSIYSNCKLAYYIALHNEQLMIIPYLRSILG